MSAADAVNRHTEWLLHRAIPHLMALADNDAQGEHHDEDLCQLLEALANAGWGDAAELSRLADEVRERCHQGQLELCPTCGPELPFAEGSLREPPRRVFLREGHAGERFYGWRFRMGRRLTDEERDWLRNRGWKPRCGRWYREDHRPGHSEGADGR